MNKEFLYGLKGNPYFGKKLPSNDYAVCFYDLENPKDIPMSNQYFAYFDSVDACIMWAALVAKEYYHKKSEIVRIIQPNGEVKKCYYSYDALLEDLWKTLTDVPMNPETEDMEEDWFIFPKGTNRESIWIWFDEQHSKGLKWIMAHEDSQIPATGLEKILNILGADEPFDGNGGYTKEGTCACAKLIEIVNELQFIGALNKTSDELEMYLDEIVRLGF